jgi:type IV secretory pathway VirB10-like protein
MRDSKSQIFLPGLLCAALASFACGRSQEPAGQVAPAPQTAQAPAAPAAPAPAVTPQPPPPPPVTELQPVPQSVQMQAETPPAAPPAKSAKKLDSRERDLAERESKIAARERRLKEREQQARVAERPAAPEPAPALQETGEAAAPAPQPAGETAAPEPAPRPEPPPVEAPRMVEINVPAGRLVNVELKQRLASNTSKAGDVFRVQVAHDVRVDGIVAIPRGSEIVGTVTEAVPLPRIGGQARLTLKLTDLVLPSGTTVPIHASLVQVGANQTGRDAATIGGGAVAGGILGNILSKAGGAKGSVIGALVGAVAGAAVAARTGKEELVLPEGTELGVKLDDALALQARARPASDDPP